MGDIFKAKKNCTQFNEYLICLISHKSVFTDDGAIKAALKYCANVIDCHSEDRRTYFDDAGNLVSFSKNFDTNANAVFLSAHIDTVDAKAAEWVSVSDPFAPAQTDTHIIGRGANDCKAGVALILLCSRLAEYLSLDNVVFLISYREEGNRGKTSTQIGQSLGNSIPLSARRNLLLCLENTVSVDSGYSIGVYDSEPCNLFIAIEGRVSEFREFLSANPEWKPVHIAPLADISMSPSTKCSATSGHVATLKNEDNVIYKAIMDHVQGAIAGGDKTQTSVVDNHVDIYGELGDVRHKAIFNYRGLRSVSDVQADISDLSYVEYYPFAHGEGSDRRSVLKGSLASELLFEPNSTIQARLMSNPGRSDASAIWNATSYQDRLDILTMGPGTRSHIDHGVARKTHGPDEGFHKESGYLAGQFILDLTTKFLSRK